MWLALDERTPSAIYKGTTYYFCTDRATNGLPMKAVFLDDPERYIQESNTYLELIVEKVARDEKNPQPARFIGDAQQVLFQCPMKCEPPQAKAGVCPKCAMVRQALR